MKPVKNCNSECNYALIISNEEKKQKEEIEGDDACISARADKRRLRSPINVRDKNEVIFLHDKAPCMKANATQHLLEDEGVNFCGSSIWPGNSPDMNSAENINAIIKNKVEELMTSEDRRKR